jgi:hypothetical protein
MGWRINGMPVLMPMVIIFNVIYFFSLTAITEQVSFEQH